MFEEIVFTVIVEFECSCLNLALAIISRSDNVFLGSGVLNTFVVYEVLCAHQERLKFFLKIRELLAL